MGGVGRGGEIRDATVASGSAKARVRHVYWGMNMIAEVLVQVDGYGSVTSSTLQKAHFWRPDVQGHAESLLATVVEPSSADPARRRAALAGYDGRGNVTTWTDGATGALLGSRDYGPYGELWQDEWREAWAQDALATGGFGFSTEYHDVTGHVYYGFRHYSPKLGRFISRDPMGESAGPNLYRLAGGDPVNKRDIWGLCEVDPSSGQNSSGSWWQNSILNPKNWFGGGDRGDSGPIFTLEPFVVSPDYESTNPPPKPPSFDPIGSYLLEQSMNRDHGINVESTITYVQGMIRAGEMDRAQRAETEKKNKEDKEAQEKKHCDFLKGRFEAAAKNVKELSLKIDFFEAAIDTVAAYNKDTSKSNGRLLGEFAVETFKDLAMQGGEDVFLIGPMAKIAALAYESPGSSGLGDLHGAGELVLISGKVADQANEIMWQSKQGLFSAKSVAIRSSAGGIMTFVGMGLDVIDISDQSAYVRTQKSVNRMANQLIHMRSDRENDQYISKMDREEFNDRGCARFY